MTNNDEYELYKELYFYELERKEQISSKVQVILSLWTLAIGAILFYISNFYKVHIDFKFIYTVAIILCGLCLLVSSYYIFRCLKGLTYGYHSSTKKMDNYKKELIQFYGNSNSKVDEAFEQYLINIFVKVTDNNIKSNDTKTTYLHKANIWLICGASLILIGFILLLPGLFEKEEPIQKVELINTDEDTKNNLIDISPIENYPYKLHKKEVNNID